MPPGAGDLPESIIDPDGRGPRIWFQQVPESKTLKNRWHFDLKVGGGRGVPMATRVARVGEPAMGHYAIAMQDPEGNEFDVV